MTDLRALTDAFTELERRADAAGATFEPPASRRRAQRLVPVAAGLAVVAGLVTGVAVLARDQGAGAAAPPVTTAQPSTTSAAPSTVVLTPEELAERFRVVLGDTATFVVTETGTPVEMTVPPAPGGGSAPTAGAPVTGTPNGAAIVGTLTSAGVTGGFDLQIYRDRSSEDAWCDAPDEACEIRTLPDGSQVAYGATPVAPGVTYMVNVRRPDGSRLLMHLSNLRSPKGASELLAPQPPLTMEQLVAVATSDRW